MPAKKIRGKVSAVLSDLVNQMESGTDSAMGIQIHRNSRLKVLAPPSHTTCLPCRQISMPPRMAMMNSGSSDERPNGSSRRNDQARTTGGQVAGRKKDFIARLYRRMHRASGRVDSTAPLRTFMQ